MAIKIKIYKMPNPDYKNSEPGADEVFEAAIEECERKIGNIVGRGWEIKQIAGGDSVVCVVFEK